MKVLIWVVCLFVASFFNVLLGEATGFRIGYILMYIGVSFVARKLCRLWDEHKEAKQAEKNYKAPVAKQETEHIGASAKKICFCRKCGDPLLDESRFCRRCGTQIYTDDIND